MTDIVERLRKARIQGLKDYDVLGLGADVIESLRQQLEAAEANCQCELIKLEQQLAESQAAVKVLRDGIIRLHAETPLDGLAHEIVNGLLAKFYDSTAIDSAIRQAKREALLEAANKCDWMGHVAGATTASCAYELRRMADELKDRG